MAKNGKIVSYRCTRIPRLTVSGPDYGSWYIIFVEVIPNLVFQRDRLGQASTSVLLFGE